MPHPKCQASRTRRVVLAWGLSGLLWTGIAPTAAATPDPVVPSVEQVAGAAAAAADGAARVAAIDAELSAARATLDRTRHEAGAAAEAYNGARAQLEQRNAEAAAATAAAAAAQSEAETATLNLSRYAAEVFQGGGGISQLDVFFGSSPQEAADRAAGLQAVGEERARLMREADAARALSGILQQAARGAQDRQAAAAAAAEAAAETARARAAQAGVVAAGVQARQGQLVSELATLRQTSVQLEQERQSGLAAQEQARREQDNRRRAAERAAPEQAREAPRPALPAAPRPNPAPAPAPRPNPAPASPAPSPSTGVGAVIAFARAQLGEPYVWGGEGPDSWDCSGLTMMAWQQAGVSLGHYTGTQWAQTRHVPLAQAQPGDLVFFGESESSISHVGLYLGGSLMLHAPQAGDVVKVSSIYRNSPPLPYVGRP